MMCLAAATGVERLPGAAVPAESRRCICRLPPAVVSGRISGSAQRCAYGGGVGLRPMIVLTDAVSTRTLDAPMPDKAPKAKAKPGASENGVLGALPTSRPERLG